MEITLSGLLVWALISCYDLNLQHAIPKDESYHHHWDEAKVSLRSLSVVPPRFRFINQLVPYNEADETCRLNFGNGYGLAVIQTRDDLKEVEKFLIRQAPMRVPLWIGGSWNEEAKAYVWTNLRNPANRKPLLIDQFVLDLFGQTPPSPDVNSRLEFLMQDQFSSALSADYFGTKRRFLCEYLEGRKPSPCQAKCDIAVLLGSSAFIGKDSYEKAKQAAAEVIGSFALNSESRQVGLVYSEVVKEVLSLRFKGSVDEKFQQIIKAPYLASSLNTGAAVRKAAEILVANTRAEIPQAIVVIVDEDAADSVVLNKAVAYAKEEGIKLVAVGVGNKVSRLELQSISSAPHDVVYAADWDSLNDLLDKIVRTTCFPVAPKF